MSPYFHKLQWLPKLCSSAAEAERFDKHIRNKVVDLMVSMAEAVGTQTDEQPDVDDTTPSNKRKRPVEPFASSSVSKKQVEDMTQ